MRKQSLTAAALLLAAGAVSQVAPLAGFDTSSARGEFAREMAFDDLLSTRNIDSTIKELSAYPHHTGSARDHAIATAIADRFISWGFKTETEVFYVSFPTPRERVLEMVAPTVYKAVLSEQPQKEDPATAQAGQLPPYNCWSPDGDVTAELVFVNYGIPDDYEQLEKMGISVKGRIVLAKYGHSWRGIKPKLAQEHGAIGCILYSDPLDDGFFQGEPYPKGPFKNAWSVQRGSVIDLPTYPGDPLTPGTGATKDAKRIDRTEAANLLKIPVLPISYHDAEPLLKALGGPVAPEPWRGGLPFTYHIGPGPTRVHLKLVFNWDTKPIYNVIARLTGSQYPDEWILRGNHHDAWVNGAADPCSGQAALLEEARAIGALYRKGWRPKRTLVYCAWDAEEPGLLGSTEWAEYHAAELQQKAVIYINSDMNARGFLVMGGSHTLEPFLNEVARDVRDPETSASVRERKHAVAVLASGVDGIALKDAISQKTIRMNALGTGSDYSAFIHHLGIPSIDLSYTGEDAGGEYHTNYDTYEDYRRFKDPGFEYGTTLAKTAGRVTLRMADAPLLPFDFNAFCQTVNGYTTELVTLVNQIRQKTALENQLIRSHYYQLSADPDKPVSLPVTREETPFLNFAPLQNALARLEKSAASLSDSLSNSGWLEGRLQQTNQGLYKAEQELLDEQGLPRRPWYRHTIYAPGYYTGYSVKTLPGVREAIEQRHWQEAGEQIGSVAAALDRLTGYLDRIRTRHPDPAPNLKE
ncbi:MAG: transferrin receptor-like dimerization domain-containing protein [Puia sp.]|nr:transferrin receptor-like dimerization domain-containing protein [Puia sp.]